MSTQFKHLFTPIQMRGVTIPNRLVNAPHGSRFCDIHTHYATERQACYYAERAKGGVGLIIMGGSMVHPTGMAVPLLNTYAENGAIPGLKMIADMVHAYPTRIIAQLSHLGREGTGWVSGLPLWAPSPLPCPVSREVPHEMNLEDIEELIWAYADAARRVLKAGFDGVEVYTAHGYLLGEFLSPYSNKRLDEYGGNLDNRMRLTFRVIDAVRAAVGEEVPVGVRLSGDEFVEGGLTLEETQEIAKRLEATGKVDYVSVSQCTYATIQTLIPEMSFPTACFGYLAVGIREAVDNIPVMAVARINDPTLAEKILADGQADMILMARGLIADPELPNKAKEGRTDEIRTCIACNVGCRGGPHRGLPIMCLQNPAVGYEKERGIGTARPAEVKKKVMVIGGGPAGLKAAEVAAERGHKVTLYEKSQELGGQVMIAAKAPTRDEFANSVRHLVKQIERLGVEVVPGVEVTVEMVMELNPDAVVVATGSTPGAPDIPGIERGNVYNTWQILSEEVEVGEKVVVVDGGEADWKFCTTADFLAQRGKKVEMITPISAIGVDIDVISRIPLLQRLKNNGVVFTTYTVVKRIGEGSITVGDAFSGEEREIEDVDSVVFAWYHRADDALYNALKGKVKELHAVGDCLASRKAIDAIRDGFMVGRCL